VLSDQAARGIDLEGRAALAFGVTATAIHDHSPFFVLTRSPDFGIVDGSAADVAAEAARHSDKTGAMFVRALHVRSFRIRMASTPDWRK
jgi:hypothetical protein